MRFHFTAEQEQFRTEVRAFLDDAAPAGWEERFGDDAEARWRFTRDFSRKLAARQWLALAWPRQYGGLEAGHISQMLYNEAMAYHGSPGGFHMGVAWVGPSLMLYGTEEQQARFLPRITSAEDVWCTLYSEPAAGSDLASLQTRAVPDGDDFIVNGQKIWTSGGHTSNWGWLAARTDPDAPKHKGISTFVLDMRTPGVTVRPLVNLAGRHEFNEVFFENVRIPKANLVGELHRGWYQVAVALDFERSGIERFAHARRNLEQIVTLARAQPQLWQRNAAVRHALADRAVEIEVGTLLAYRIASMQAAGRIPNHEASMSKLYGSELTQRLAATGLKLLGQYGHLMPESRRALLAGQLSHSYLNAASSTIAAGTSEIQRGVIAGRGLGLPRG